MISFPGGHGGGATPVPIPNTAVKSSSADGTARAAWWESRTSPGLLFRSRPRVATGASIDWSRLFFCVAEPLTLNFVYTNGVRILFRNERLRRLVAKRGGAERAFGKDVGATLIDVLADMAAAEQFNEAQLVKLCYRPVESEVF